MTEGSSMEFLFETNADQTLPAIAKALGPAIEALEELRALGDFEIGGGLADGFAELPGQADKAISKVQDSLRRLASGTDLSGIGREIGGSLRELQDVLGKVESAGGSRMQLVTGMEQALRAGRELLSVVREINQAGTRPQTYGAVSTAFGAANDRNMALGSGRVIDGEVVARSDQRLAEESTRQADVRRQGTQVEQRLNQANERLVQEKEAEARRIAERGQQSSPFSHPEQAQPTQRPVAPPPAAPFLPQEPARPAAAPTGTPVAPFSNPQAVPTSPARPDVAPGTDPFRPAEQQLTQAAQESDAAARALTQAAEKFTVAREEGRGGRPRYVARDDDGKKIGHLTYDSTPQGLSVGEAHVNKAYREQGVYSQMREALYREADASGQNVLHSGVVNPMLSERLARDPRLTEAATGFGAEHARSFVYNPSQQVSSSSSPSVAEIERLMREEVDAAAARVRQMSSDAPLKKLSAGNYQLGEDEQNSVRVWRHPENKTWSTWANWDRNEYDGPYRTKADAVGEGRELLGRRLSHVERLNSHDDYTRGRLPQFDERTRQAITEYTADWDVPLQVREPTRRDLTEGTPAEDETARILAQHVRNSPQVDHPLYRGIDGEYAKKFVENVQPGDRLPLGVTSWTDEIKSAATFAPKNSHGAILEAAPGARGFEVVGSDTPHRREQEYLSGGNFEVTGKRFDEETQRWIIQVRAAAEQFVQKASEALKPTASPEMSRSFRGGANLRGAAAEPPEWLYSYDPYRNPAHDESRWPSASMGGDTPSTASATDEAAPETEAARDIRLYRGGASLNNIPGTTGAGRFFTTDPMRATEYANPENLQDSLSILKVSKPELEAMLKSRENEENRTTNGGYHAGDVIVPQEAADRQQTLGSLPVEESQRLLSTYEQDVLQRHQSNNPSSGSGLIASEFLREQLGQKPTPEFLHGINATPEMFKAYGVEPTAQSNGAGSSEQAAAAEQKHTAAVETDTEALVRGADAAKEFVNAVAGGNGNGNGSINGHGNNGNGNGHGGSGGDGGDGGDGGGGGAPKGRFISEDEMSKEYVTNAAQTGANGIRQIANTGHYYIPEKGGTFGFESGGKTEAGEELKGGWREVVDAIERQGLSNKARIGSLGPQGERDLGQERSLGFRPVGGFDPDETPQTQYALAQRIRESRQAHGGYDPALMGEDGYKNNLQTDFTPVKGSTTLFRDLNDELVKVTRDLASYNVTIQDQISAEKARTEADLRQAELDRGEAIRQGLPGFEQISDKAHFYNTPQGAPAILRPDGRASITLNSREELGAQKAQEDANRATQEKATADRVYSQAVRNSTRLNNIAQKNPADELRDLGGGYSQLGETLMKRTQFGLRLIQGEQELYEASLGLARTLEKQGRAHVDQNVWQSFMGGAFGHGFESNQQFKPQDALKNLAGTAGVLARYGGEGRLLFGAVGGLNDTVKQYEEYQKVLVDLKATQEALSDTEGQAVNTHVNLNEAYKVGAEYGMNEVDSIQAGIGGLKAFSEELKNGKSASDIFTQSVQAAGVAAVLTGKSVAEIQPTQNAIANEFQLGSAGLGRVNDAAANAGRHFNVPLDRIYSGMQASGDIAGLGGFDPERLGATVAAVDDYTGKDSGAQIARELAQGGSARFRTAVGNLGVQYDAKDVSGTLAKAGEAYKGLDDAQKAAFATQLGGARTAEVVIALLQQQAKVAETTAAGYRDQGKALQEAHDKQATFGGELTQLRALLQDLATDLGKLGLIDAFGGVLELISPIVRGVDDLARVLDKIPGPVKDIIFAWGALRGLQGLGGGVGLLGTTNMMGRHNPGYLPGVAPRTGRQNARRGFRRITGRNMDPNAPKESAKETAEKQHTVDVEADTKATVDHTASVVADTGAAKAEAEADALATKSAQDLAAANAQAAEATEKRTIADTTATEATERRALADDEGALSGAASGLRGFTGGASGLMGAGILATFGYGMVRDTWDKTSGILNTKNTAEADTQDARYTGSAADLRSDASKANTDAQNAAVASGGVTGTILNWLTGGNGAAIKQARATATRQNDLAGELDKIDAEGTQNGVGASLDISSPDSLDASLKALQATGASTADVVDALGGALDTMAKSGKGALGTLNPTDVKEMAARGGSAAKGSVAGAISSAEDEGLGKGHGFGWRDLIPGVGVVDVAKWAGDKAGGIGNIAPQIGRTTGSVKQRRDSAKHDLKSLKNVKQDDVQKVASTAVQDYLTDNPSYDPKTDQNGLADYIDQMLANNNVGLSDKEVDPNTRHQIALDVARTVQGAASAKVDGANTTSATVQAAFNDAVTADAAKSGTVGSLAGIGQYTGAAQVGDTAGVAAAREKLADDKKALEDAKAWRGKDGKGLSASQIADDEAKVADDQVALNSALNAQIGDQIKINQSHRALSDTLGRGLDNIAGLQQQLDQAKATGNPHDVAVAQAAVDDANKQQAVDTAATQAAGMGVGINDTTTGVSTGNTPSFDPRDTLGNAQRGLAGDTFTFNQLDGAEKGMAQHSQQWIDAFKKLQEDKHEIAVIELNAANAAIDAAALPGDAMGAAADAIAKAKNTLDSTLPGTPEHDAAVAALNAANYGGKQAGADWKNAQTSALVTPGDDVQAAGAAAGNAKNKLDADTKYGKDGKLTTQYMQDLAAYRAALYAAGQAIVTEANAEATAKVFPGDALGAARTQVENLKASLAADAYHSTKWWQDWGALQAAKVATAKAEIEAASIAQTLGSDTTDPVAMARIAADKARATTAADRKANAPQSVINTDVLAERQANNAAERASFDQWLSDTKINMELGRTSFATYMQLLEGRDSMLKAERARMKVGSDGYRQFTDEINATEQQIHDAMNQLSGQFNLGDIKMPTLYEVRRSNATAQAGTGYNDNRTVSIVINGIGSTQEVVQVVKQQLGTAATVTNGPTSTRKV